MCGGGGGARVWVEGDNVNETKFSWRGRRRVRGFSPSGQRCFNLFSGVSVALDPSAKARVRENSSSWHDRHRECKMLRGHAPPPSTQCN